MINFFYKIKDFVVKHRNTALLVLLAFLIILPIVYKDDYYKSIMVKILFYSVLASSMNIINGYSGQFSLGHAGFMCVGAYTAAILATKLGWSFWVTIIMAGLMSAIIGYLISLPTLKLRGIYLTIVTLGFSEIVRLIALNWESLTGGAMGIKNIPPPVFFGIVLNKTNHYYYLCLGILVITLLIMYRLIHSKIGRAWIAIREDQLAASSLGVEISKYKCLAFVVGAFFAGVGGCIMAYFYRYISSDMFVLDETFNIISMVIIGGQGTLVGPIIGTVIVNILTELFRFAEQYRMVFYAILIILMMWCRPQGLVGASNSILAGNRQRSWKIKRSRKEEKK
ncbi:MAG: branched-chain amino acid ABC transporter permease [Hydrogenoanaerobacterium sp.]